MPRLLLAALVLASAPLMVRGGETPRRPNVLVICGDDHAAYALGAYGNPLARTPALDRLAAASVRFDRAYCNSPVCTASRQSFLTGRYPRTIGVTLLKTPLPEAETTLAELFAAAGYRTAAIGKMHFNSQLPHGFALRFDEPQYAALRRDSPASILRPGVDVQPPWRPFRDPAAVWLNAAARPVGLRDAEMQGTCFANEAARYLAAGDERPFFLLVSFYEPHSPFRFPLEYARRRRPAEFTVPPVDPADDPDIPAVFRDLSDDEKRGIAAAYYTSVEYLDANVGRVLAALADSRHADNTVVVYLSDHGYLLGQHGRFEKHCMYEPAVRVPLLIRVPGAGAGRASDALVELVDLAPTLLELCGTPVPPTMQGRSLAGSLTGTTDHHRDHVVIEYAPNDELAICDQRWKLVFERGARRRTDGYDTGRDLPGRRVRLFDRQADPNERHDVAADHPDVTDRLIKLLVDHALQTARLPADRPATDAPLEILDWASQPNDVE